MALIVEDGTGRADAESYISVADANTYFANLGNATWDALDDTDDKEPALRKAASYMVDTYRQRWQGYRTFAVQALDWPRTMCPKPDILGGYGGYPIYYGTGDIPTEVKQACAELALRAAANDLLPDVERFEKSVTIGVLKVDFDPASPVLTTFPAIARKLRPLLNGGGGMPKLVRT